MTIPIAGIGASAGGLEACKLLLAHLPANSGLAFVFIQHLDPRHHSDLAEILARSSAIPVRQATDGMKIESNHLYVIPPDAELEIENQALKVTPRDSSAPGPHLTIDHFLRSLAGECGSRAIGVILSGAGSDGAAGLEAVKAAGGVTLAQEPATAKFGSMPQAAIGTGCVDFVLAPVAIAAELTKLGHHPYLTNEQDAGSLEQAAELQFESILELLRGATGIDFSLYRKNTIQRRILRRLALRNLNGLAEYGQLIAKDPLELSALHRDLLISVTSFFRDPDSFERLNKLVFPRLVKDRAAHSPIRIWVPGCATGEEAYSIAIALQEYLKETGQTFPVQIFASDISAAALEKARSGRYSETISADVSPERLNRHFMKLAHGYQISMALREMCVFSRHDLIQDPPFSKLDLISCRNVLIFFGIVKNTVIARFHYALKAGGILALGPSESASGNLFSAIDGQRHIYLKNEAAGKRRPRYDAALLPRRSATAYKSAASAAGDSAGGIDPRRELERALLARYSGAGVMVDANLEVLEIRGQAAPYLALPRGRVSLNLLNLIPDTRLFLEVEKLIREVEQTGQAARRIRVPYASEGDAGEVNVEVMPFGGERMQAILVLFEPATEVRGIKREPDSDPRQRQIASLKQDLADAHHRLLTIIEDHQLSEEDSQSTAEEAVSANEELQSLNEELETAKEELQSSNEELSTINQELLSNNAALTEARDFAMSIIEAVTSPLLVLDSEFRIKSANPAFHRAFRIPASEVEGKLIFSVSNGCWDIPRLRDLLERVLPERKAVQDFEIEQDFPGIGQRVLVLNARLLDGVHQVLLGINDVTERDLRLAAIVESSDDAILSKALDGTVVSWNSGAARIYGYTASEIIGRPISTLSLPGQEAEMSSIMDQIRRGQNVRHLETRRRRKDGGIIDVSITISPIQGRNGVITGASVVARDITELKRRQQESLAKQKLESVGTLASGIAHDFNNLLGGVLAHAELSMAELAAGLRPEAELQKIRAVAIRGAEIVRQLMIYAGQETDVSELVDISKVVEDMVELLKVAVSKHAALETDLGKDLPPVRANPAQIRQVVMNLISNASEAVGDRDGVIRLTTRMARARASEVLPEGDYLQLEISDTGCGMSPEVQARVFDPFFTTRQPGHGLGLSVVQGIVRSLRGTIRLASTPGKGTTFQVLLPCAEGSVPSTPVTPTRDQEGPPAHAATVLVVEDEDSLRGPISIMLRKQGLTVLEANDGSVALDLIRVPENHIDLLFLDISLPGLSSREVLEETRRVRPGLPVIVTSAYSEERAANTLATPIEHFIRKPYRLDQLMNLIRESLPS